MPHLLKDIVTAGKYSIPDGKGGHREVVITPERLSKWAANFEKQRNSGFRVPAPAFHDFEKGVPVRIGSAEEGFLRKSTDNLGFWDYLWVDPETNTLKGIIDAPGDFNDPNTPAGKLGKTVRETSIYVTPTWKDGSNTEWDEPVMHIACVTHPIEKSQANFQPADNGMAIAMSFKAPDPQGAPSPSGEPSDPNKVTGSKSGEMAVSVDNGRIAEVITMLKDVAKISIPEDTNQDNIVERLLIALSQKALENSDEDEGGVDQPPEGAQLRNAPFVMSFTNKQIEALSKVTNPETGKPFTPAELGVGVQPDADVVMSHPRMKELERTSAILLTTVTEQAKLNYRARANALVSSGRANKGYVDSKLTPMIDAVVMSFGADGKPQPLPIDTVLDALEAAPAVAAPSNSPSPADWLAMSHGGYQVHNQLPHSTSDATDENAPASQDAMNGVMARLKSAGLLVR